MLPSAHTAIQISTINLCETMYLNVGNFHDTNYSLFPNVKKIAKRKACNKLCVQKISDNT